MGQIASIFDKEAIEHFAFSGLPDKPEIKRAYSIGYAYWKKIESDQSGDDNEGSGFMMFGHSIDSAKRLYDVYPNADPLLFAHILIPNLSLHDQVKNLPYVKQSFSAFPGLKDMVVELTTFCSDLTYQDIMAGDSRDIPEKMVQDIYWSAHKERVLDLNPMTQKMYAFHIIEACERSVGAAHSMLKGQGFLNHDAFLAQIRECEELPLKHISKELIAYRDDVLKNAYAIEPKVKDLYDRCAALQGNDPNQRVADFFKPDN